MKKIVLLLLAIAGLAFSAGFGTSSQEEDKKLVNPFNDKEYSFLIGTASESGTYHKAGTKAARLLENAVALSTDGSKQNLDLLNEGKINVAFVQGDVYNLELSKNPSYANKFTVLLTTRKEFVQLIMRDGMTDGDLQKKGSKVIVGLSKSGGAGTYLNMQLLEPNYVAEPIFDDVDQLALNALANKKVDGIIRTSYLEPGDAFATKVLNTKGLYFADIDDSDLNDKITLNGETKPIYEFKSVSLEKGMFGKSAKMLETSVYVVINNELTSRKQRAKIADVLATYKDSLFQ